MPNTNKVWELCRLSDGRWSCRKNGQETAIMPPMSKRADLNYDRGRDRHTCLSGEVAQAIEDLLNGACAE